MKKNHPTTRHLIRPTIQSRRERIHPLVDLLFIKEEKKKEYLSALNSKDILIETLDGR